MRHRCPRRTPRRSGSAALLLTASCLRTAVALVPPPALVNTAIGFAAGSAGALVVYPLDFAKTQLQTEEGRKQYDNLADTLAKIVARDGPFSLYRGCGVQVFGVAPEKALKLTVNDAARAAIRASTGSLSVAGEIAAGICAGTCQVVVTNPLEVVKVRLQTDPRKLTLLETLSELGPLGLFQGGGACMLRDATFSAILFPTYGHTKLLFAASALGPASPLALFLSGLIAAAPAAFLTTPLDVVKTRQQATRCAPDVAVVGSDEPDTCPATLPEERGLLEVAQSAVREEGAGVLFSGALERVLRSSPQFGVTLALFDYLQSLSVEQGWLPS